MIDPDVQEFLREHGPLFSTYTYSSEVTTPVTTPTTATGGVSPGERGGRCVNGRDYSFLCRDCGCTMVLRLPCGQRLDNQCAECASRWRTKNRKKYMKAFSRYVPAHRLKFIHVTNRLPCARSPREIVAAWHATRKILARRGYRIGHNFWILEYPAHIHSIVDCDYIPQAELSKVWHEVTGDSAVVWIEQIDRWKRAVNYCLQYMTKTSGESWDRVDIYGCHLLGSHGVLLPTVHMPMECYCGAIHCWIKKEEDIRDPWITIDFR